MERRKTTSSKSSTLPVDYTRMVVDVFTSNFDGGLRILRELKSAHASFQVEGKIFTDEVLLCVSLIVEGQLSATSVYASCDFDPKASSPTVEEILGSCVDGIGSVFSQLLSPANRKVIEQLAEESPSALDDLPVEWTPLEVDRRRVYLRADRANPNLDKMADEWLEANDPQAHEKDAREQSATEKLFVTGPKKTTTH